MGDGGIGEGVAGAACGFFFSARGWGAWLVSERMRWVPRVRGRGGGGGGLWWITGE